MKRFLSVILAAVICLTMLYITPAAATANPADDYIHTDAANEDETLGFSFEYASEKVKPTDTSLSGKEAFTVYMAKNEIEDAQFALYSETDKNGMTASLDALCDGNGNELSANVYIELYMDCGSYGMVPDPIPPLEAYGAFSLEAGKSQTFIIRVKTTAETVAGLYSAHLHIYDENGAEVKVGMLYVNVWDFALSDETACATSINLDYNSLTRYASVDGVSGQELYRNYYEYLLDNRVCAYYLPELLYKTDAQKYMDNPRVTSFQVGSFTGAAMSDAQIKAMYDRNFKVSGGEERFNKSYFFSGVVDAATPNDLERLRTYYDNLVSRIGSNQPDYADVPFWMINTFINDIDYNSSTGLIDQIEYYMDFVNFWCSKPFAYTRSEELSTPGAKVMQPSRWDLIYGTFSERMASRRAAGQRVWWFTSWDVNAPYINYFTQTDGVAQRILFWQQYDNGVEGYLTNFVNYWVGFPYVHNVTDSSRPEAYGESILIYPGSDYGLAEPVGSLRLEAMRDGIEDYQLFTMLDEMRGEGASDSFIDEMTQGMVTYSVSDEHYYETRKALGASLEAIISGVCEHNYEENVIKAATCTEAGESEFVCTVCGDKYSEETEALGHSFVDGVCTLCGEKEITVIAGDVSGDGNINAIDVNLLKKHLGGQITLTGDSFTDADVNGDNSVNSIDANLMKKFLGGVISEF